MKKTLRYIILAAMMLFSASVFAASKKSIVCTTYPEYDWILNILGKNASSFDVTLLQNKGTDLHSYQPTVQDMAKISACDLFVYVGGESDGWVEKALHNAANKNMLVINMMEVLGDAVREEEHVEGMQESEHHHHHDGEEEHEHEGEAHEHHHDEEITEADIMPREVSEFAGTWQSLYPVLMTGALDEYVEYQANKKAISVAESRAEIEEKWNCGVKTIKIKGNKITLIYDNGKKETGTYKYAGFATKKDENGKITSIRHKFLATSKKGPKYVMLNDHGHKPVESVEHFHIYFGNNSFEELVTTKSNPFFVDSRLDAHECLENVMGHELGHNHAAEGHEHHHHEGEVEYDEHVWLSLKNAIVITKALSEKVQKLDGKNASVYKANTDSYVKKLAALDADYEKTVSQAKTKTLVFADRFPFRYLTDDYGLTYYAAFAGCSAESEASFETVIFLAKKVDEFNLKSVLTIEKSNKKIAKTVVANTKTKKQQILEMDSLQSVTQKEITDGKTYLGTMQQNLEVLKTALN